MLIQINIYYLMEIYEFDYNFKARTWSKQIFTCSIAGLLIFEVDELFGGPFEGLFGVLLEGLIGGLFEGLLEG